MSTKGEQAKALFQQGYNCAQAVVGAYAEELGLDFDMAMQLSSGFGGGIGRMREVCGTVSGMVMVAGLRCGKDTRDMVQKQELYQTVQKLAERFREENGSIICKELLGLEGKDKSPVPSERTTAYYKKRPCSELVAMAASILEEELF